MALAESAPPEGYQGAVVHYVGNQVQLTLNGTTTTVAADNPRRLDPMFAQLASVSPDGWTLLYVTADSEDMSNTALTTVNLKTQRKQLIATFAHSFWVDAPRWAPDSSRIVYTQHTLGAAPELWVMNATGANARMVTTGGPLTHTSYEGRVDHLPRWSADGKSVIFYDSAYKPTKQWTVNVASGATTGTSAAGLTPNTCPNGPSHDQGVQPLCYYGGHCYTPVYSQNDSTWSGVVMQSAKQTIGNDGCALVSLTMLFDYNGSTVGNPGGMANCLNPWGYADPVNWVGAQTNPPNGPGCDRYTTNFISRTGFSWSSIDTYLRNGWPVIAGGCWDYPTCNNTHWVLIVGGDGSDNTANYWINDPYRGVQEFMNSQVGLTWDRMALYQKASGPGNACE